MTPRFCTVLKDDTVRSGNFCIWVYLSQILEVNRQSFEHNMTLQRALTFLKESTHLEMSVKSNLLGKLHDFTLDQ